MQAYVITLVIGLVFASAVYEIEFRCHFASIEEAMRTVPLLHPVLAKAYTWVDTYYGPPLFLSGQVLRISEVVEAGKIRRFLGWKGVDTGVFANLRAELNEEITQGVAGSAIMEWLSGEKREYAQTDIVPELKRLGYRRFMSYAGDNLYGKYFPQAMNIKLMHCAELRWPYLLEIEKIARDLAEAQAFEIELNRFCSRLGLEQRVVREEPGTLLYQKMFGGQS